ncbi:glutamyl-tRNA reductase [Halogeometricum borinquense]|uniref:Glutamyl-tRNA reductase n=1 Tax=Halogeometricum borinquense TaxID=60847 RepID=A0A6C0UNA3_9EURY|nr:glutamyl-tRNA reductase [Halogeometricum borinquense]QIB74408.1 glutamyl-tRNA reductase [Halogeometricum borinquense]
MHRPPTERSDDAPTDSISGTELDIETAQETIRASGESIKRDELERAFATLESEGELTTEQRRIVERMATEIVDEILAAPQSVLETDKSADRTAKTVIKLFSTDR